MGLLLVCKILHALHLLWYSRRYYALKTRRIVMNHESEGKFCYEHLFSMQNNNQHYRYGSFRAILFYVSSFATLESRKLYINNLNHRAYKEE